MQTQDIVDQLFDDILPCGRGVVVMVTVLNAYLDRGAKKQAGGVMCVAAALFKPTPYKQFRRQWNPLLKRWGAEAFHATDFYNGAEEFSWKRPDGTIDPTRRQWHEEDSKRIPVIVGAHAHELFVVSFRKDEYEALAPLAWRQQYGGVHRLAAQMMGSLIGFWAKHKNYPGKVAYFYETGDEEGAQVTEAFRKLYDNPRDRDHCRMAATPIGVEKGTARGLEAADFLAWHWNKFFADTLAAETNPRRQRRDVDALLRTLRVNNKEVHVRLFMGTALEEFLVAHGCTKKLKSPSGGTVA